MKKVNKKEFVHWLEHALPFDVWIGSDRRTVKDARDYIFKEIGEDKKCIRRNVTSKYRDRECLLGDPYKSVDWPFCRQAHTNFHGQQFFTAATRFTASCGSSTHA